MGCGWHMGWCTSRTGQKRERHIHMHLMRVFVASHMRQKPNIFRLCDFNAKNFQSNIKVDHCIS